jgi:hypothetical protein
MAERIFLSYAQQDRAIADRVQEHLRDYGIISALDAVIVDPRKGIEAGDSIRAAIRRQMVTANKVVMIISPNSAGSLWVNYEAGMASALGKPVYVIARPGMEDSELLQAFEGVDSVVIDTLRGDPAMTGAQERFKKPPRRGRGFQTWEESKWNGPGHKAVEREAGTKWKGKRGRIDLRLVDREEGHSVLVEIKASYWDRMAPHRVRPNALRHARQLWRLVDAELEGGPVLPAIVYPVEPETPGRKEEIEAILHERSIQVVWRELDLDAL